MRPECRFSLLEQPKDKVQCMHVYIDGTLRNFRTKDRTWPRKPTSPDEFERLEFCGSATDFDVGNLADYYAHPVKLYRDPFRGGDNTIVFCDTYNNKRQPTFANNRYRLLTLWKEAKGVEFTFHQPYALLRKDGRSLGYMDPAYEPESKSGFSCGREVAESHYRACLYAGVQMASLEPLEKNGQWRFSVSARSLLQLSDDVWASRFMLQRVAEDFGVVAAWGPAPLGHARASLSLAVPDRSRLDRLAELLRVKFATTDEQPVTIKSSTTQVCISGTAADIDPYSLSCKVVEACGMAL